jgi:hypothetical protein
MKEEEYYVDALDENLEGITQRLICCPTCRRLWRFSELIDQGDEETERGFAIYYFCPVCRGSRKKSPLFIECISRKDDMDINKIRIEYYEKDPVEWSKIELGEELKREALRRGDWDIFQSLAAPASRRGEGKR